VETLKYVVDCNVPTIALTDNAMSPLATLAHYSFFIGTDSPNFFPSHVPTLLVLETLVDMVIRERGVQALQHIAAVERQNHKLNEYWRDGPAKPQGDEQ
jgi:DNA-binding MurR/RpiR family transcriptional regulator